jgi:methylmalonyl-CoA mutase
LKFGDAKLAGLRADFCRDLFSVLGFSVQMGSGQLPALEQIQLAPAHAADIIILCASNSDYTPEKILELKKSIGSSPIWVAGKCDHQEELKKAGVDEFVYLGCDMELIFRKFLVEMVNSEFDEA